MRFGKFIHIFKTSWHCQHQPKKFYIVCYKHANKNINFTSGKNEKKIVAWDKFVKTNPQYVYMQNSNNQFSTKSLYSLKNATETVNITTLYEQTSMSVIFLQKKND